ncbi:VOC family protein [Nonomuraea sp. NPDC046802]|uniref:VOC family protein n=1 Tax=Nonomuraea sp. NPDC046802 TaxID=3154919 RepID=UPI0033F42BFB
MRRIEHMPLPEIVRAVRNPKEHDLPTIRKSIQKWGCTLAGELDERTGRLGPPSQPDVQILLKSPDAAPDVSAADRQAIKDLMANGLLGHLVFLTDNCDATFEHIAAAGAEVMQEPINQPHGVRDCAFLDPSGNMLRFTQPWPVERDRPRFHGR